MVKPNSNALHLPRAWQSLEHAMIVQRASAVRPTDLLKSGNHVPAVVLYRAVGS